MDNVYKILGISETTSLEDAKKSYRRLCARHHPDNGGDADMFDRINKAWETYQDIKSGKMVVSFGRNRGTLTHKSLFRFAVA